MYGRYIKLAEFKIEDDKSVVISAVNENRVSIGQKVSFTKDGEPQDAFLKNAIVLDEKGIDAMVKSLEHAKKSLKKIQSISEDTPVSQG